MGLKQCVVSIGILGAACKYGENGWQRPSGLYARPQDDDPLALHRFVRRAGPEPSYNNWCDLDRLLQTVTHAVAGLEKNMGRADRCIALTAKHGNCCGAAYDESPISALRNAVMGDKRAIFGGVVLLNFTVTSDLAGTLLRHGLEKGDIDRFLTVIAAPSFEAEALAKLCGKRDRTCVLENPGLQDMHAGSLDQSTRFRYVRGGFLMQPNYTYVPHLLGAERVGPAVEPRKLGDVAFAWAIGSTSNSNTVTIVRERMLVGNGVGQQDRVGAAELALKRARDAGHEDLSGAVAYSDSFFPFPDGPLALVDGGVRIIFATSGSIRDKEVREACAQRQATLFLLPDPEARGFFGH